MGRFENGDWTVEKNGSGGSMTTKQIKRQHVLSELRKLGIIEIKGDPIELLAKRG